MIMKHLKGRWELCCGSRTDFVHHRPGMAKQTILRCLNKTQKEIKNIKHNIRSKRAKIIILLGWCIEATEKINLYKLMFSPRLSETGPGLKLS